MAVLPDFTDFGSGSDFSMLPDLEYIESSELDPVVDPTLVELPYGVDYSFNFLHNDLDISTGGDLLITSENKALEQWISVALLTPLGQDPLFNDTFGSTLSSIIGQVYGYEPSAVVYEINEVIRAALLQHDRIEDVINFRSSYDEKMEQYTISFTVLRDDAQEITFEGLTVG